MKRKWIGLLVLGFILCGAAAWAAPTSMSLPGLNIQVGTPGEDPKDLSEGIRIVLLLTVLSLAPSFVIMTTSFTRIMVVFGFLRRAMGTQSAPPSQILAGLSIFMTIFIMMPVWNEINEKAIQPYQAETITSQEAWTAGVLPLRKFMAHQTGESEYALFVEMSGKPPAEMEQAELSLLVPAFVLSELKTSFKLGFLIYLPFLLIDLVTATVLMSLGMMMLPPMTISLPIKILFFVLADGWTVLIRGLLESFLR
jgi:flagellar biosynthetic protein FliP